MTAATTPGTRPLAEVLVEMYGFERAADMMERYFITEKAALDNFFSTRMQEEVKRQVVVLRAAAEASSDLS
jgi:hypothetical protein